MAAGPYPTKTQFVALKSRVTELESDVAALPGAEDPAPAGHLGNLAEDSASQYGYGAVTPVPGVMALKGSVPASAKPFWLARVVVRGDFVAAAPELRVGSGALVGSLKSAVRTYDAAEAATTFALARPLLFLPGDYVTLNFSAPVTIDTYASGSPWNDLEAAYKVQGENFVAANIRFTLWGLDSDLALPGSLSAQAMPVVRAPFMFAGGVFEIVDPTDGSAPYLRYVNFNGQEYHWPGTLLPA